MNKIVGLGTPDLEILASICDFICPDQGCVERCQPMNNMINRIFELQRLAGFEEFEEDSELGENNE